MTAFLLAAKTFGNSEKAKNDVQCFRISSLLYFSLHSLIHTAICKAFSSNNPLIMDLELGTFLTFGYGEESK